jgi:hypothetical protein
VTHARTVSYAAWAALALALVAVVLSSTADSDAARRDAEPAASSKPRKFGVLRLNSKAKIPLAAIPTVRRARNADRLGGRRARALLDRCAPETVDLGTVCLMASPYPLTRDEVGKNDFFFATQACAELGGYLPTAAQLIGAAPRIKLAGRADDNEVTASTDVDATDGLKDRREMSATLTTTASGARAAGSQGVSDVSRGDPRAGEPDPAPVPANPSPETLHYVTVYDNGDLGGFAGGKPVGQPELFRCAFNKAQGNSGSLE